MELYPGAIVGLEEFRNLSKIQKKKVRDAYVAKYFLRYERHRLVSEPARQVLLEGLDRVFGLLQTDSFEPPEVSTLVLHELLMADARLYNPSQISPGEWEDNIEGAVGKQLAKNGCKLAIIAECTDCIEKTVAVSYSSRLAERLLRAYYWNTQFFIVERTALDKILQEHHLSYTGLIEGGPIEAGKILGIDHLIIMTLFDDDGRGEVKLINTTTGNIIAVSEILSQDIVNLMTISRANRREREEIEAKKKALELINSVR